MFGEHYESEKEGNRVELEPIARNAVDKGYDTLQFFMLNPKAGLRYFNHTPKEKKAFVRDCQIFERIIKEHNIKAVAHAVFQVSVRRILSADYMFGKIINVINVLGALGVYAYNLHIGSSKGITKTKEGFSLELKRMAAALTRLIKHLNKRGRTVNIVIENEAHGFTLEQLSELVGYLSKRIRMKVGVCLDTAHLWGYGVIFDDNLLDNLKYLDTLFPKGTVRLIHLNGSVEGYGSKIDRHGHIFDDPNNNIPTRMLLEFVKHYTLQGVPFILETKPRDTRVKEIGMLQEMFNTKN